MLDIMAGIRTEEELNALKHDVSEFYAKRISFPESVCHQVTAIFGRDVLFLIHRQTSLSFHYFVPPLSPLCGEGRDASFPVCPKNMKMKCKTQTGAFFDRLCEERDGNIGRKSYLYGCKPKRKETMGSIFVIQGLLIYIYAFDHNLRTSTCGAEAVILPLR